MKVFFCYVQRSWTIVVEQVEDETCRLEPIDSPFGPKCCSCLRHEAQPMCLARTAARELRSPLGGQSCSFEIRLSNPAGPICASSSAIVSISEIVVSSVIAIAIPLRPQGAGRDCGENRG